MEGLMAHCGSTKLSRDQIVTILPPVPTDTFKPIAHADLVKSVVEGLSFRHINVVRDEYAVSEDVMKLFGVLDLEQGFDGARYSLGLRNANDKSMRLALTVGYRIFVCDHMAFHGDFIRPTLRWPVRTDHEKCNSDTHVFVNEVAVEATGHLVIKCSRDDCGDEFVLKLSMR